MRGKGYLLSVLLLLSWPLRAENNPFNFNNWIRSISGKFTYVKMTPTMERAELQGLNLNQNADFLQSESGYYSGIRFHSPAEPGSLVWFFAYEKGSSFERWYILPASKEGEGFRDFHPLPDLSLLPSRYLPWTSNYKGIVQQLPQSFFQPDTDYLIWFKFKAPTPTTIYTALKVVPLAEDLSEKTMLDLLRFR